MSNQQLGQNGGFLRLAKVLEIIPVGKSTWWAGVKSGRFPKSVKLGKRTTAWRVEDIQTLVNFLAGKSEGGAGSSSAPLLPAVQGGRLGGARPSNSDWVNRIAKDRETVPVKPFMTNGLPAELGNQATDCRDI